MEKSRKHRIIEKKAYSKVEKVLREKRYKCFYPGCDSYAVASHSQQRSGPLKVISRNNKVYAFDDDIGRSYDFSSGELKFRFREKGIGEASRFKGFCDEHENMFSVFEANDISEGDYTQACYLFYRTIAYEISRKRKEFDRWDFLKSEMRDVFSVDGMFALETITNKYIKYTDNTLNPTLTELFQFIESEPQKLHTLWHEIDHPIGASCSACINFHLDAYADYADKHPNKPLPFFTLNLLPNTTTTWIVASWVDTFHSEAVWLIKAFSDSDNFGAYLNRFLFCDSEDTCVNPDIWEAIDDHDKLVNHMRHVFARGALTSIPMVVKI